jgi:hypothetical protein
MDLGPDKTQPRMRDGKCSRSADHRGGVVTGIESLHKRHPRRNPAKQQAGRQSTYSGSHYHNVVHGPHRRSSRRPKRAAVIAGRLVLIPISGTAVAKTGSFPRETFQRPAAENICSGVE